MTKQKTFPALIMLGLIFITLKLTGFITWSWWGVLAPFWVLPALNILVIWPVLIVFFAVMAKRRETLRDAEEDQRQQDTLQGFDDTNKH